MIWRGAAIMACTPLFCVIFLKFNLSLLDWFKRSIIYLLEIW